MSVHLCVYCLISYNIVQSNDCGCASGTGSKQDGREWSAMGTNETKHMGTGNQLLSTYPMSQNLKGIPSLLFAMDVSDWIIMLK